METDFTVKPVTFVWKEATYWWKHRLYKGTSCKSRPEMWNQWLSALNLESHNAHMGSTLLSSKQVHCVGENNPASLLVEMLSYSSVFCNVSLESTPDHMMNTVYILVPFGVTYKWKQGTMWVWLIFDTVNWSRSCKMHWHCAHLNSHELVFEGCLRFYCSPVHI